MIQMALVTFNPPIAPSPGTRHAPKISVNRADFGDGYTQTSPSGLNHIRHEITLRWDGLTGAQYLTIRDFFETQGGYRPFWYQPRGFSEPQKWTAPAWSGADASPWNFEATLEQWFGVEG